QALRQSQRRFSTPRQGRTRSKPRPGLPEKPRRTRFNNRPRPKHEGGRRRKRSDRGTKMGTRADFYVGRGESAEWIGSIAMDGNPRFLLRHGVFAASIEQYRQAVADLIRGKDHGTSTAQGWPWPWDNSCETE